MLDKVKNLMTKNEKISSDARIHWIVFVPSVMYTIIGLCLGIFYHPVLGCVVLVMTLYPLYNAVIHYTMTHLILTNKKVMARVGFLTRDWVQMAFERIENAHLQESILGRYFGYSTVIASGVGAGTIAIPFVVNGDTFIKKLETYLDKNRQELKPQKFSEVVPELKRIARR